MANRSGTLLQLALPDDLNARVDDYRFANRIASRSAAIRELVELGLTAKKPARKKAPTDAA